VKTKLKVESGKQKWKAERDHGSESERPATGEECQKKDEAGGTSGSEPRRGLNKAFATPVQNS